MKEGKKLNWLQRRAIKLLGEDKILNIAEKALTRRGLEATINRSIMKFVMPGSIIHKIDNKARSYIEEGVYGNPDLYSVVSWIAGKAAEIPWKLYQTNKAGEKVEILSHKALDVWRKPNDRQGGHEFREETYQFYLATGNGYWQGVAPDNGSNKGQWIELYNLPAQDTEIVSGGWKQPVRGYKLHGDYASENEIPKEDVLHLKTTNLEYDNGNYLYGSSPVRAGVLAITSSTDAYTTKAAKFQNQGIEGFISIEGDGFDDLDGIGKRIEEKLLKKYTGPHKAGRITAISPKSKWNQVGISIVDLALLDSINADLRTICRMFKIDSKVLNDPSASTYNNVKEARMAAYTDAIIPLLNKHRDEVNRWYTPRFGDNLIMEPDYSKVPELQDDLSTLVTTLMNAWWIPPNEKLRMMGKDEYPDPRFDKPWVPFGIMPLDEGDIPDDQLEEELKRLDITSEYKT